ncbi:MULTISPECIES: aspartate kinase [unclassified Sphingomonas]|uniref:aspartate kinase n=1 Tax=unclassified Sphingomonas TaxID=196159 RepID=UPI0006FFC71B|nr:MULTISPECIES: aspartate kinase [unclassified Sphingomonas]KQX19459.1 aspartate kinase [Sphingomonas sp. Root1294]KQY65660.1 aspartate kinase [Sphingomonas sp. Root50]KRB95036.1 aspartate kinase [Sphingomonas sp. Root720]
MSGCHSVEKIGGTSMIATATLLDNVLIAGRKDAELYGRIFVVSAYAGMTDLLLEHKKSGRPGVYTRFVADDDADGWRGAMEEVRDAMHARNAEMFVSPDTLGQADAFVDKRIDGLAACLDDLARVRRHGRFCVQQQLLTVRELLAGLGEAHSAHNTTLLLRSRGVNAVLVDFTLWEQSDLRTLDERIVETLKPIDLGSTLPIVTGYTGCREGMVQRYARGYSEITFSRVAVLTQAREAIIHKEFHLSSADPKLFGADRTRRIGRTNYDVADQLANLGMEAIHPGAGRGLRQAGIPLRVRNTFDREGEGTLICGDYVSESPRVEIVTGIRRAQALQFFEQDMVGVKGYDAAILEALARHDAWIVSKSSNANTITHYLSAEAGMMKRVIDDLQSRYPDAAISAQPVAIVSAIGSDISRPSLMADALGALASEGIDVMAMHHQIRNVDVQFVIDVAHYDAAVRALHEVLVEDGGDAVERRCAA